MPQLKILRSEAETSLFPKICFLCEAETKAIPQSEAFTYDPNRPALLIGAFFLFRIALVAMASRRGVRQNVDLLLCRRCSRALDRTRRCLPLVGLASLGCYIAGLTYAYYADWGVAVPLFLAGLLVIILYWGLWYRRYSIECLAIDDKHIVLKATPSYIEAYQRVLDACALCPHCSERLLPGTRSCFHCGRGG